MLRIIRTSEEGVGMTELKPCPFCGGKAKEGERLTEDYNIANFIICGDSGCRANIGMIGSFAKKEKAISAWNTRPETPERAALRELVDSILAKEIATDSKYITEAWERYRRALIRAKRVIK